MASEEFSYWFTFVLLSSDLLILSKICLLIIPISDFDGLISLNDEEFGNPSLRSFTEIKASVSCNCWILSSNKTEVWRIKDNKHNANIPWEILGRHQAYSTSSKRCSLCLNEKLKIVLHRDNNMLNRRTEILNKCRHKHKYALISYGSKD